VTWSSHTSTRHRARGHSTIVVATGAITLAYACCSGALGGVVSTLPPMSLVCLYDMTGFMTSYTLRHTALCTRTAPSGVFVVNVGDICQQQLYATAVHAHFGGGKRGPTHDQAAYLCSFSDASGWQFAQHSGQQAETSGLVSSCWQDHPRGSRCAESMCVCPTVAPVHSAWHDRLSRAMPGAMGVATETCAQVWSGVSVGADCNICICCL